MATALLFVTLGLTLLGSSAALNADPTCSTGILEESALVCCAKECTRCGGPSCGNLPGGSTDCCIASVEKADKPCSKNNPPCMLAKPTPVEPPTACGFYPEPLSTTQPNVLLIGDSISMPVPFTPGGYGAPVHDMLTNEGKPEGLPLLLLVSARREKAKTRQLLYSALSAFLKKTTSEVLE